MVRIRGDARGLCRVGLLGVPSPRYSYPPSCSDSRCCLCHGVSGRLRQTRSYVYGASSSRALHRFIVGTDRSPDWFRLLLGCLGRAGRHRRTRWESLCPQPDSSHIRRLPATSKHGLEIWRCLVTRGPAGHPASGGTSNGADRPRSEPTQARPQAARSEAQPASGRGRSEMPPSPPKYATPSQPNTTRNVEVALVA